MWRCSVGAASPADLLQVDAAFRTGEGIDGLRDRTRRRNSIPNTTPGEVEDAIVRARKELADAGEFNGLLSIADRLAAHRIKPVPSRATIAGILACRG